MPPQNSPGRRVPREGAFAALVLLSCLASTGCSPGLKHPVHEVTARLDADGVQRVEVTAHSYWYEPNRIVVKSGTPVEIHVRNAALLEPHGFTCMAPAAGIETQKIVGLIGKSKTIRFTPKEPGEYPFFCQVWSHSKKGMTGTLVVQ